MTRTETVVDFAFIQNLLTNDLPPVGVVKKGKKTVSFSRRDLEKIRYFRTEEPVCNIRTQQEQAKDVIPFYKIQSSACRFSSMNDILRAIRATPNVALDNVVMRYPFLEGYVFVKNICFHKRVVLRYTLDGWRSVKELEARYDSSHQFANLDRFCFSLDVAAMFASPHEVEMQFAIRYEAGGQQFWENNGGENYSVKFVKRLPPLSSISSKAPLASTSPASASILASSPLPSPSPSPCPSPSPSPSPSASLSSTPPLSSSSGLCSSSSSSSSSASSLVSLSASASWMSPCSSPLSFTSPTPFSLSPHCTSTPIPIPSSSSSSSSSPSSPSSASSHSSSAAASSSPTFSSPLHTFSSLSLSSSPASSHSSSSSSSSSATMASSSGASSFPIPIPIPVAKAFPSSPHSVISPFLSSSPKSTPAPRLSSSPKGSLDSHYLDQHMVLRKSWETSHING